MERTYQIDPKAVEVPREDIGTIDPETHMKYFSAFLASLLEDFGRYTHASDFDVVRDGVHYLQVPFLAAPEEFASFMQELAVLIKRLTELGPAESRIQRTVSIITLPEKPTKAS
ncbi:MAG: hypothetical protein ACRESE_04775 [Gammaproteobacteria bacterium]